jgi:hypothetical protein
LGVTKYPLKKIKFEKPDEQGKMHDKENQVYCRPDAVGVLLIDGRKKMMF